VGEFSLGIGKSAIAVTVSNYLHAKTQAQNSAYIVTTQKILQEQYTRDFPYIASITAKNNYQCINRVAGVTCDMGLTMAKVLSKSGGAFNAYAETCVYRKDKKNFDESPIGLTNLAYFLSHAGNDIKQRNLLVVDECHNIESVVTDFAALNFSKHFVEETLKIAWPIRYNTTIDTLVSWIKGVYAAKLSDGFLNLDSKVSSMTSTSYLESNSGIGAMKKLEEYKRKIEQISIGLKHFDRNEWVMTISPTQDIVSIKPIFADKYTNNMLFRMGEKVIMMSGTILDKDTFCRNVGIKTADTEFLSLDSPFPIANRPVFEVPVGSMGRKSIDATLPKMVATIKELLGHHIDEKGIIHCHTYKIAKYISDNIKDDRLLFHSSDDRVDALNFHIKSKEPTVLVSPSFTEGIDLTGKLSRFQIIIKLPFPFLGDNYVKEKMSRVGNWYNWNTVKTIIQASGRSIRDYDDWCVSYILDSDWKWFYERNEKLMPVWWKKGLIKS
jgi:Rad3-related DNA helicase